MKSNTIRYKFITHPDGDYFVCEIQTPSGWWMMGVGETKKLAYNAAYKRLQSERKHRKENDTNKP